MADPATIGKYRIDSVLGKGTMGVVYKAFDLGIERAVAIKTVRKDLVDPDLVEQSMARFNNEARAGSGPSRFHEPRRELRSGAGRDDHDAAAAGAGFRARAGRHPSRHQAGQSDP